MPGASSTRSKTLHLWTPETIPGKPNDESIGPDTHRDLQRVVRALEDHKGVDIRVLDLRKISNVADFFVIASGTSDTHVRTLAERVLDSVQQDGRRPHHIEGVSAGRWALLDFVDVVVHVFHPTLRDYYQLERLWADAPELSVQLTE